VSESAQTRGDQCWRDNKAAESWVRLQDKLDAELDSWGRAVLDKLAPRAGERALDVGCGSGQTLLELADLVGPMGRVLGVDIAEPMVERARERVAERGCQHVQVELGDAQTHVFPHDFELQFSRFGVMFFQDPAAAFRNLFRALREKGRLGFVCWQAIEKNAWAEVVLQAIRPVLGTAELPQLLRPGNPGPFNFSDPSRIESILASAGYVDVDIEPREQLMHFGGAMTLEEAVEFASEIGPAARAMAEVDPELRPECRARLAAALAPFVKERGVWLGSAAFIVTAKRD
jgi:ubiquinone/menaquinone biosynthesis C-methylase UbiE